MARPSRSLLPQRVGGFGGVEGLAAYLRGAAITHLVDATHPFAETMSFHAVDAARASGVDMAALTRPPWEPVPGDDWHRAADMAAAAAMLNGPPRRVFLAIGRLNLDVFATRPQHHYVLRLIDPPDAALPLPDARVILDRGPFDEDGDLRLMRDHGIDVVVSKNSGGSAAYAKLAAARRLGLPVIMIDRPPVPERSEFHSVEAVMDWLGHAGTLRGV